MIPQPPTSTLFPYTTLFRSLRVIEHASAGNGQDPQRLERRDAHSGGDRAALSGRWCQSACSASEDKDRSEEHTSELQSRLHLVCRLLLEKKNINKNQNIKTT